MRVRILVCSFIKILDILRKMFLLRYSYIRKKPSLAFIFGQFICTTRRRGRAVNAHEGSSQEVTILAETKPVIPALAVEGLSLPGGSGSQPLSVSLNISEEVTSWMTEGIPTETSKAISKEFPLEFVDAEFSLKPLKLDGWISRRAPLKTDRGVVRSINAAEESFT